MKTILIQIPLLADKKAEWDLMINHPEGIALTRKQKGFISAEFGYTTDVDGNLMLNLWEKWETQRDFENYNSIPERLEDSKFMQSFGAVAAGPPSMLWLQEFNSRFPG
mgnify:FL=1